MAIAARRGNTGLAMMFGEPSEKYEVITRLRSADSTGREIYSAKLNPYMMEKKNVIALKDEAISRIAASIATDGDPGEEARDELIAKFAIEVQRELQLPEINPVDLQRMTKEIREMMWGYGPLDILVKDPDISEIMVNTKDQVSVERHGKIQMTDIRFDTEDQLKRIIASIVEQAGRHIDEKSPIVDCTMPDGSRVNAVLMPVALKGHSLNIRKFSVIPYTVDDLVRFGTMTETMADFLRAMVQARISICISGGTGSGKTTLLNVLSAFIPSNERIITIENAAELQLQQPMVVTMQSRDANIEGTGEITIRDLVINALRQRPDRIIVGEVRGAETVDMLQAMNTGHDGSLTTIHANEPRAALQRIETTYRMSGMEMPSRAIREQCCSAFQIIIQQKRYRDGTRKISQISEICGMNEDTILMQDLYTYKIDGETRDEDGKIKVVGHYEVSSVTPLCYEKIRDAGISIKKSWMNPPKGELYRREAG